MMTKLSKRKKESLILIGAVLVMTLKIMVGVILFHNWRLRQERLGHPVGIDDELE